MEVIGNKIKIFNKCFSYMKEVKSIFSGTITCTKEIYYIGKINDTKIVKKLFENSTNIIIENKNFYCPAELKTFNKVDYFMENVKLIEC